MRTGRGGPAMGTVNRPAGRVSSRGSPSTSRPSGPADGEVNAVTLVASALRTKRAAWISSANTTTQPRSRSSGLAAARTAARMLAGPSAPAMAGVRIAPVTTTGSGPACSRSSRNEVSSMVSVPWITTAPAAPAASCSPIAADSSNDVVDGQRGAGQLAELAHLDPGAGAVEPGHRVEQLPPGQHRAGRHGDGAAEGEHRHPGVSARARPWT